MPLYQPTGEELQALVEDAKARAGDDAALADSYLFHALYHHKDGLYPRRGRKAEWKLEAGEWVRYRRNLSRREWIEAFFPIRTKAGLIVKLTMNPGQRRLWSKILRLERAGVPVRVLILKARKIGFSTLVQAIMFEALLRGEHFRGLIVADKHDTSQVLLQIASVARTMMEKTRDAADRPVPWNFKLTSKASYSIAWDRPISGEIKITSAETDSPGRGMTPTMIHESEVAWFKDAAATEASVMSALPSLPGTYAFKESTANTDTGKFRDDFWRAWAQRETPIVERGDPWDAMFFAWYEDPDYCWTRSYGMGRPLPAAKLKEILDTLDKEEDWLLKQTYLRRWSPTDEWEQYRVWDKWRLVMQDGKIVGTERDQTGVKMAKGMLTWRRKGVGMQPVTVDQLAWRRLKIVDADFGGDMDLFNREMPSRPELAFMASGSPVFDPATLNEYLTKLPEMPVLFRGFVSDAEEVEAVG